MSAAALRPIRVKTPWQADPGDEGFAQHRATTSGDLVNHCGMEFFDLIDISHALLHAKSSFNAPTPMLRSGQQ